MGCSLKNVIEGYMLNSPEFLMFSYITKAKKHLIFPSINEHIIYVMIANDHTPQDDMEAYFHAVLIGLMCSFIEEEKMV